jgi:hypothetical protein
MSACWHNTRIGTSARHAKPKSMKLKRIALILGLAFLASTTAHAQQKKPNILVIWGDDVGYWSVSAYN